MWLLDKQLVTRLGVQTEGWNELWLSVGWKVLLSFERLVVQLETNLEM